MAGIMSCIRSPRMLFTVCDLLSLLWSLLVLGEICEPVVLSVLNLVLHSSILSLQSSDVDLERRWLGYHEMNDAYCMPELGWNAVG